MIETDYQSYNCTTLAKATGDGEATLILHRMRHDKHYASQWLIEDCEHRNKCGVGANWSKCEHPVLHKIGRR